MMVKKIEGASLKVQIFLYYAGIEKNSTNIFPDFEQDMTEFNEKGLEELQKMYDEIVREYIEDDMEDLIDDKDEFFKKWQWVSTSEARILADRKALEVRDELVKEGFLFTKVYDKYNGGMHVTYTGLTNKGKKWAPKYIAKYGKAVIS